MLSGLRFWLSPARRRFRRHLARPALAGIKQRARQSSSPAAFTFLATLAEANLDFLAWELGGDGDLRGYAELATPLSVTACLNSLMIYSVNLFAHQEMARNESELISLLAAVLQLTPVEVMVRRDALRKSPRSEEWTLYSWLLKDLGAAKPAYEAGLERSFGYQYISYIGQYRPLLEQTLAALS